METLLAELNDVQSYDNLRTISLDSLSPAAQCLLLDRLDELPILLYLIVTLRNSRVLPMTAWGHYGGAGFFTRRQPLVSPYRLALILQALRQNAAWSRAHAVLVANYLTRSLERGDYPAEVFHIMVRPGDFTTLDDTYLACVPEVYDNHVNHVKTMGAIFARRHRPDDRVLLQTLADRLAAAKMRREQLFRDIWLPALIPAAEYAQVRNIQPGLLTQLYAAQYADGYPGYQAQVASSGAGFAIS